MWMSFSQLLCWCVILGMSFSQLLYYVDVMGCTQKYVAHPLYLGNYGEEVWIKSRFPTNTWREKVWKSKPSTTVSIMWSEIQRMCILVTSPCRRVQQSQFFMINLYGIQAIWKNFAFGNPEIFRIGGKNTPRGHSFKGGYDACTWTYKIDPKQVFPPT